MRLFKFYLFSMVVIFSLAIFGLLSFKGNIIKLNSQYGNADFSFLEEHEIVELGGSWEYYEDNLYEDILQDSDLEKKYTDVPHEWGANSDYNGYPYGYATYITELQGLKPHKYYGIFIIDESLSYRVYINDKLIIESGKVGRSIKEYVPELKGRWGAFNSDEFGNARLVIEIANFEYHRGGFWIEPRIAEFQTLKNMAVSHTSLEIVLFISMLIMGLFLLTLYAKMKSEKTALLMSIFSLLVSIKILFSGYRIASTIIPGIPWIVMNRIEYIVGYLLLPVMGYMTCSLGYVKQSKIIAYINHGLVFAAIAIPIFTSSHIYGEYFKIFKFLVIVYAAYFLYTVLVGIYHKKQGAIPIAIGYICVVLGAIVELFLWKMPFVMGFSTIIMVGIFTVSQIVAFSSYKIQKENLESEIIIDKLTSVYNRLYLEQLMAHSSLETQKDGIWYVMFIDVNKFKSINDNYGHHIGDEVLIRIAHILKQSVRDTDLIFRYGGDEFVLFISLEKGIDPQTIEDRIQSKLQESLNFDGHLIKISLSIGITEYQIGKETLFEAVFRSDEKMYDIKQIQTDEPMNQGV